MIEVKVNQSDFDRVINAINGIERVVLNLKDSITEESAREFSDALKQNIDTQKFKNFGTPHKDWKKGQPHEEDFWIWLETAFKAIKPNKLSSTADFSKWFVGFGDYAGGSSVSAPAVKRTIIKKPGGKTVKPTTTTWAEKDRASRTHGPVIHVNPVGYVPQKQGPVGRAITFGQEIKHKKIISDTSHD
jgi:hypothetical protein